MVFNPTEHTHYDVGGDKVEVQVEDSINQFAWRLVVNGNESDVSTYYEGILMFKSIGVATAYWLGSFEEFVPFKASYGQATV